MRQFFLKTVINGIALWVAAGYAVQTWKERRR